MSGVQPPSRIGMVLPVKSTLLASAGEPLSAQRLSTAETGDDRIEIHELIQDMDVCTVNVTLHPDETVNLSTAAVQKVHFQGLVDEFADVSGL